VPVYQEYTEDLVEYLTDRWGELLCNRPDPRPELVEAMFDELSFVASRGGRQGVLIENEYMTIEGECEIHEALAEWKGVLTDPTEDNVCRHLAGQCTAIKERFPGLDIFLVKAGPIGRLSMMAFVPEDSPYFGRTEEIGDAVLGTISEKEAA